LGDCIVKFHPHQENNSTAYKEFPGSKNVQ